MIIYHFFVLALLTWLILESACQDQNNISLSPLSVAGVNMFVYPA